MKFLFITPKPVTGGAEKITCLIANRMARKNHIVHFACICDESDAIQLPLSQNITPKKLGKGWKGIAALAKLARSERYDAIFSSFLDVNLAILAMSPLFRKSRLIFRDALAIKFSYKLTRHPRAILLLCKLLYRFADKLIAQTEEMADANYEVLGYKNNFVTIPNPIGIMEKSGDLAFPEKPTVFLSIGRLSPQKGFPNLINAFATCKKQHPDIILDIVGDGNEAHLLQNTISSLSAEKFINLIPHTKNLLPLYTNSHVYLLSSKYEGFCNTALEALSFGIPIVASTKDTGIKSMAVHQRHGILVESNDVNVLASGINEMIQNYSIFNHQEISNDINKRFDTDAIMDRYESILCEQDSASNIEKKQ